MFQIQKQKFLTVVWTELLKKFQNHFRWWGFQTKSPSSQNSRKSKTFQIIFTLSKISFEKANESFKSNNLNESKRKIISDDYVESKNKKLMSLKYETMNEEDEDQLLIN